MAKAPKAKTTNKPAAKAAPKAAPKAAAKAVAKAPAAAPGYTSDYILGAVMHGGESKLNLEKANARAVYSAFKKATAYAASADAGVSAQYKPLLPALEKLVKAKQAMRSSGKGRSRPEVGAKAYLEPNKRNMSMVTLPEDWNGFGQQITYKDENTIVISAVDPSA